MTTSINNALRDGSVGGQARNYHPRQKKSLFHRKDNRHIDKKGPHMAKLQQNSSGKNFIERREICLGDIAQLDVKEDTSTGKYSPTEDEFRPYYKLMAPQNQNPDEDSSFSKSEEGSVSPKKDAPIRTTRQAVMERNRLSNNG